MATAQTTTGTMIPTRSASLPITMLATPNEIMVSVYGNDASPRAAPNSAWIAGSATTTDHIPTPPMVESARLTTRRSQAYGESASPCCARSFTSRVCHERARGSGAAGVDHWPVDRSLAVAALLLSLSLALSLFFSVLLSFDGQISRDGFSLSSRVNPPTSATTLLALSSMAENFAMTRGSSSRIEAMLLLADGISGI